jgi:hypothetical protein
MNTIGIAVTNFGRNNILRIFCAGVRRLREDTNLPIPAVCCGDIGGADICREYGIEHIEQGNKPLTEKFNTACHALKGRVDYVMVMGSDNVLSTETFLRIQAEAEQGTDLIGLSDVYFYGMDDITTGQLFHFTHTTVLGVGRTIKASVLDNLNWKPWTEPRDRGIDSVMLTAVRPYVKTSKLLIGGHVFDLKTSMNLNRIEFWARKIPKMANSDLLWNSIGAEERRLIEEYLKRV